MSQFRFDETFNFKDQLKTGMMEQLHQIGLARHLFVDRFSFTQHFEIAQTKEFVNELVNSEEFQSFFRFPDMAGERTIYARGKVSIETGEMLVTVKRLENMMPAVSNEFIGGDTLKGSPPEHLNEYDMDISTVLQQALFDFNNKEQSGKITHQWKCELANSILSILLAGGAMSQPLDKASDYLTLTTTLYKIMAQPVRLETDNQFTLKHISCCRGLTSEGFDLFPTPDNHQLHPANRCYFVIDSLRRYVYVLYCCVWN